MLNRVYTQKKVCVIENEYTPQEENYPSRKVYDGKKEIMSEFTSKDVKEFIENDLRKIYRKEHEQRMQEGMNRREARR